MASQPTLVSSPSRPSSSPDSTLHANVSTYKPQGEDPTRIADDSHEQTSERASGAEEEATAESSPQGRRRRKKMRQLAKKLNPALTLENSGSVARDHLASERTFLAYVRTSLTIASMGVALVQLFTIAGDQDQQLMRFSRPLGATIIMIGLCTLFLGVVRYFTVQYALVVGKFPVARVSTVMVAVALCTIITAVFGILVANKG